MIHAVTPLPPFADWHGIRDGRRASKTLPTVNSHGHSKHGPWRLSTNPVDERGERARPVQQQLLRHAGRPRRTRPVTCRCSTSTTSTSGSSAATRRATARRTCPPTCRVARSLDPRRHRDAARLQLHRPGDPGVHPENCTGCMDCVTECPDTAILGKVLGENEWEQKLADDPRGRPRDVQGRSGRKTKKYYDGRQEEGTATAACSTSSSTLSKCKGCAECVTVCDDDALKMIAKTDEVMTNDPQEPPLLQEHRAQSNEKYINDNLLIDMMLKEQTHIYIGGAGSCAGCGEGTALRMLCAATGLEVRRPVGHRRRHRLQHGLHLDVSVQPVPGAVDELAVRERPGRRHGRAHALGPDGLAGQAAVVHRRRRGDVRHRLPVAVADVRQRHEHQGVRARHAGLLEHRRPGLDRAATPARTPR